MGEEPKSESESESDADFIRQLKEAGIPVEGTDSFLEEGLQSPKSPTKKEEEKRKLIKKKKERLESLYENPVEKIGEKFNADIESGLAGWSLQTKMIRGSSVEGVSTETEGYGSGVQVEPWLQVEKSKMEPDKEIGLPRRDDMPSAFQKYGNALIIVEPIVARDVEVKDLEVGFFKKVLTLFKKQQQRIVTERVAVLDDFGDTSNKERMMYVSIYYVANLNYYKEGRPINCKLHIKMRESLTAACLKEIKKDPDTFWNILKSLIPELLSATPPAQASDRGKRAIGILDSKKLLQRDDLNMDELLENGLTFTVSEASEK